MKRAIIVGLLITLLVGGLGASNTALAQANPDQSAVLQSVDTSTPTATPSKTPTPGAYERPLMTLVSNTYDKNKAYVGGGFTLTAKFKNSGQKTAYNMVVTFTSTYLQPLDNGGVTVIPSLAPGEAVTFTQDFFIRSDINTYQTMVDISIEYKDEKATSYTQKFAAPISVYWLTSSTATPTRTATPFGKPQIVVTTYTIDKATLQPGSNFVLTLNIKNFGAFDAKNVTLTMGATSSSSGTTTSTSFLPIGSSNVRALGDIPTQKELQLQQSYVVNSTTTPGAYPLSLRFEYKDPNGVSITDEQIITLLVYLVPSIDVSFYEVPPTYTVGVKGNLPIQIVNLATSSILLGDIVVSVEDATLANYQMFIGTVDGGGNFTIDTEMTPRKAGAQTVKVAITYQDNFKNLQTINRTLSINVNAAAGAQPGQSTATSLTPSAGQGRVMTTTPQTAASETIWQMILRFIRGFIGFDSAAPTAVPVVTFPNQGFFRMTTTPAP